MSGRAGRAALLGVCALGAALRFATLGHQSFDFDESFTVGVVLGSSLGHALHTIPLTESSPPLYYVLAWLWSQVFGLGAFGIRALSAACGTALVAVTPAIARRCGGGRRAALLAAAFVAVNPLMVWYSQEARVYALLALLSALSFWAFLAALERPEPGPLAAWAVASALALASHYFAGFLVLPEAAVLLWRHRSRLALAAAVPVVVGGALVPLALRQSDHRTDWIEALGLASRIREVVKKWLTGEIAPRATALIVLALVLGGAACVLAWRRLEPDERRWARLAVIVGAAALVLPLLVDLAGRHYLISKNVMPALTVLLIGLGLVLGARRGGLVAIGAGLAITAGFLALTVAGAIDPTMQRPDYKRASAALGPPEGGQVVVTPELGDRPVAIYRHGAVSVPAGFPAREVIIIRPLPRADVGGGRGPTPPPPPGFVLRGRWDARTYTLICFAAPQPVALPAATLVILGGPKASAQAWPGAPPGPTPAVCRG